MLENFTIIDFKLHFIYIISRTLLHSTIHVNYQNVVLGNW